MPSQTIIWTALPNGVHGTAPDSKLRLTAFVSPRLDPLTSAKKLGTFPDFLAWPGRVLAMTFEVEVQNVAQPILATRISPDPDPDLWQRLFNAETFVRGFQFKSHSNRNIFSIPVRGVLGYLKQVYRQIAETEPSDLPKLGLLGVTAPSAALAAFVENVRPRAAAGAAVDADTLLRQRETKLKAAMAEARTIDWAIANDPAKLAALGFSKKAEFDFFMSERFYGRPENKQSYLKTPDLSKVPPVLKRPEFDFHEAVAALGDYSLLLRRLGLAVDLELPMLPAAATLIRVKPTWGAGAPAAFHKDKRPWTKYILGSGRFLPAPRQDSDIRNGLLDLRKANEDYAGTTARFSLVQVDPDGAALKASNFARTARRLLTRDKAPARGVAYDTPPEQGLPALRSAGIAVMRHGRAAQVVIQLQKSSTLNTNLVNTDPVLEADDLTRGYRVDLLDGTAWRSLCERVGSYIFPGRTIEVSQEGEEGYVKGASTTSADNTTSDLYLHETMFRWDGWSLCAQRPGRTIVPKRDGLKQEEVVQRVTNTPSPALPLQTDFHAKPASLPRLRFGKKYKVRARVVDLAGNSIPADAIDPAVVTDEILFTRFEPVPTPVLVPRAVFGEGESVERMVIRSNFDASTSEYVASEAVQKALTGKPHTYAAADERHVVPPKTAQLMAEQHGMFDDGFGPGKDHEKQYRIAKREEGTLYDRQIVDLATGDKVNLADPLVVQLVTPPGTPPPPADLPLGPDERVAPGQYVIHREEQLVLPYLPDVFGRGAAFRGIPGATTAASLGDGVEQVNPGDQRIALKVPFPGSWPDRKPFRIRIVERTGTMPPGNCDETFTAPPEPKWDADTRVLTVFLPKGQIARVRYSVYLDPPDLEAMGIWKWLEGSPQLNALKTRALAGVHWMLTPFRELVLVHAVQQPLCQPKFLKLSPGRGVGETFATLRGQAQLSVKSTAKLDVLARWEEPIDDLSWPKWQVRHGSGHAFELPIEDWFSDHHDLPATETPPHNRPRPAENLRHEFGDTKYRLVSYYLRAATRFREYFAPEITADPKNITREGPTFEVKVKSSARPAAPKVVYVVPTYKWDRKKTSSGVTSTRKGNGLRVYLERPWFSSGDGELLAVVLRNPQQNLDIDRLKPYITQWGKDPIWGTSNPKAVPNATDFPLAVDRPGPLSIQEIQGALLPVAGHTVEYDETRGLWYCDIEVDAGASYYPFVRLALARYQPNSVPNCHLSRVVLCDFAQLAPDRHVDLTVAANNKTVTVQVTGTPSGQSWVSKDLEAKGESEAEGRTQFAAEVQIRPQGVMSDLAWEKDETATLQRSPAVGVLWKVTITFAEPIGAKQRRLVIQEHEKYYHDPPLIVVGGGKPIVDRLVYAEILSL